MKHAQVSETFSLRKQAEKRSRKAAKNIGDISELDVKKLIHELDVHQIELEMQSEALQKSQIETAESQYKYSDLYDFAPIGYFTFDRKGHIIEANVTGASLLVMEKRSLAKQPFQRFIVHGCFSIFQSHLQKAHDLRSKQTCKLKLTGKDGNSFDALIDTIAVIDSKGKLDHYRSAIADITEITRAEEELRESAARYRAIFDGAMEGMYRTSLQGKNLAANPALAKMLGYDSAEDVVSAISDSARQVWVDPDERARFVRLLEEQGTVRGYECQYKKKDGTKIWVSLNSRAVRGPDGRVVYFEGFIEDITERKQAEAALRESERRMKDITFSMADWVWEVDENGVYTYSSSKGHELFGHVIGKTPFDFMPPDEAKKVAAIFSEIVTNKAPIKDLENWNIRKNGEIICLLTNGVPILDEEGNLKGYRGVDKDITERKRIEAELQERLQEIERLKLQLEKENIYLREELRVERGFEKIIGSSDALNYVLFRVGQVAPTDATVLILGETGTGKGMVANAIHSLSSRKERPMITVNCAALPANLIESELFGREKGAFTGAHARQAGRFEVANGGTIFLDEIGELPQELQSKLLRVLQDGEFERLGNAKTIKVDVRVIASTSRDLKKEVRAGRFRQDLFYRLNVFPVSLPTLRKRADDIPQLVRFFVDKYAHKIGKQIETIPKTVMKALQRYSWPGNVRELEHVIERAVIITEGQVLQIAEGLEPHTDSDETDASLKDLAAVEREHVLRVLRETGWKISGAKGAASILNLHPSTLHFRIKKLGIKRQ